MVIKIIFEDKKKMQLKVIDVNRSRKSASKTIEVQTIDQKFIVSVKNNKQKNLKHNI